MRSFFVDFLSNLRPIYVEDCLGVHKTRSLARVGAIDMVRQGIMMGMQLVSLAALGRLLAPSTFGLMAMAVFFRELMRIISTKGFVESAVQKQDLKIEQLNAVFWLNAGVCTLLALIFMACGPLIAKFYGEPELGAICLVLGLLFILENLFLTHHALLRRTMSSELTFIILVVPSVVSLPVSIVLAVYGFGVWALVGGTVFGSITQRLLFYYFVRWAPGGFRGLSDFKDMLGYGFGATWNAIIFYLSNFSQSLALGKFASPADVGFYSRGQAMYQSPMQQITWPIASLLLPALASLQGDRQKLLGLMLRSGWLVALVCMPFTLVVAVFGHWIAPLILGEGWGVSGEVVRWLAVAHFPILLGSLLGRGNAAIGRPARGTGFIAVSLPVLLLGIFYTAPYGPVTVAQFYAIYRWSVYPVLMFIQLKGSGFDSNKYLSIQIQLLGISLIALALLWYAGSLLGNPSNAVKVLCLIFVVAIAYAFFFTASRLFSVGREVLSWSYDKFGRIIKLPGWLFI